MRFISIALLTTLLLVSTTSTNAISIPGLEELSQLFKRATNDPMYSGVAYGNSSDNAATTIVLNSLLSYDETSSSYSSSIMNWKNFETSSSLVEKVSPTDSSTDLISISEEKAAFFTDEITSISSSRYNAAITANADTTPSDYETSTSTTSLSSELTTRLYNAATTATDEAFADDFTTSSAIYPTITSTNEDDNDQTTSSESNDTSETISDEETISRSSSVVESDAATATTSDESVDSTATSPKDSVSTTLSKLIVNAAVTASDDTTLSVADSSKSLMYTAESTSDKTTSTPSTYSYYSSFSSLTSSASPVAEKNAATSTPRESSSSSSSSSSSVAENAATTEEYSSPLQSSSLFATENAATTTTEEASSTILASSTSSPSLFPLSNAETTNFLVSASSFLSSSLVTTSASSSQNAATTAEIISSLEENSAITDSQFSSSTSVNDVSLLTSSIPIESLLSSLSTDLALQSDIETSTDLLVSSDTESPTDPVSYAVLTTDSSTLLTGIENALTTSSGILTISESPVLSSPSSSLTGVIPTPAVSDTSTYLSLETPTTSAIPLPTTKLPALPVTSSSITTPSVEIPIAHSSSLDTVSPISQSVIPLTTASPSPSLPIDITSTSQAVLTSTLPIELSDTAVPLPPHTTGENVTFGQSLSSSSTQRPFFITPLSDSATTGLLTVDTPETTALTSTTKNWLPSSIIFQKTDTTLGATKPTSGPVATSALPKAISPVQTGSVSADYELITVGFKEGLNYAYVVESSISSAQIFEYLPSLLTHPFSDVNQTAVFVKQLVPYTSSDVDYIITVAEVYFDRNSIALLQDYISDDSSIFYENPNSAPQSLGLLIDSQVPITGLIDTITSSAALSISDSSSTSNDETEATQDISYAFGSMDSVSYAATSSMVKVSGSKLAGIIAGSSVGVAVYVLLVTVFYKMRKNSLKKRSSSEEGLVHGDLQLDSSSNFAQYSSSIGYDYNNSQLPYKNYSNLNSNVESSDNQIILSSISSFNKLFTRLPSTTTVSSNSNKEIKKETEQTKYIPVISNPVNVKNSLGW